MCLLILLTFGFLWSQAQWLYEGGCLMLRLSLKYVFWWWHLKLRIESSQQQTIKLGSSGKLIWVDVERAKRSVGSI